MSSEQTENPIAASSTKDNQKYNTVDAANSGNDNVEEGRNAYHPGGFHPVYIDDVYGGKYQVMNKLGYGRYSTVWLVKDLSCGPDDEDKYRALKILSAECYGQDHPIFEREILRHLRDEGDHNLAGYKYVCHLVDDFEHQGPNGSHVCLVFELMGETLRSFGLWFRECMVPTTVMRKFSWQLVCALELAHNSGIIHTDIKPDNIFVKVLDKSRIESEYFVKEVIPQQDRTEEHYTPIPSSSLRRYYFGADAKQLDNLNIALGDWGVASWTTKHLTENIQPVALRAPEVLIKACWDARVDFWNLGAVLYEVYRAIRLFSGRVGDHYELREHLGEIVDVFGPFPKDLLEKGDPEIVKSMFNEEGKIDLEEPFDRPPLESDLFLPNLDPETREVFASFLRFVMKINPEERPTPDEMVEHPWLTPKRVLKGP